MVNFGFCLKVNVTEKQGNEAPKNPQCKKIHTYIVNYFSSPKLHISCCRGLRIIFTSSGKKITL